MLSKRVRNLIPYVPGEQPQDRQYVKLNTNENPFPPSPRVAEFLARFSAESLRLYPDPKFSGLRRAIGERIGVDPSRIFVGNGSDEILSFLFYAFFDSDRGDLLFPEFTYSFYPVYCDYYGIGFRRVPLRPDFRVDVDRFLGAGESCGIIFPNPNAPTGVMISVEEIARLLRGYPKDQVVAIDEAYVEFGGESALPLVDAHPNLLVVRTFSKSLCLAGLRIGYAVGDRALIDALYTAKDAFNSYPVGTLAQKIGEVAIADGAYYAEITRKIIANREYLEDRLRKLGWQVLPSKANFVFMRKSGVDGETVYRRLKERGVLVRYFHVDGIKEFVRVTIGTREALDTLLAELSVLFGGD